jgi:hypothetical protein
MSKIEAVGNEAAVEREKFEAVCRSLYQNIALGRLQWNPEVYVLDQVQFAWKVWLAALSGTTAPTKPDSDHVAGGSCEQPSGLKGSIPDHLIGLRKMAMQATSGPWSVYVEVVPDKQQAKDELLKLVDGTPNYGGYLPMIVSSNGLASAVTGCGKDAKENAYFIAAANPAAVLEMIGLIEELNGEAVYWRDKYESAVQSGREATANPSGQIEKNVVAAPTKGEARDAERLDWLEQRQIGVYPVTQLVRDPCTTVDGPRYIERQEHVGWTANTNLQDSPTIREAIDAAMQKQ